MATGEIRSIKNAEHYTWGQGNDGWHLLKNQALSVIEERMVAGSAEQLHLHREAQQLFYILSGKAEFEIGQEVVHLGKGEAIHVPPGTGHRISNMENGPLYFLVISSPKAHGDRIEL